jgi:hypothetical protein
MNGSKMGRSCDTYGFVGDLKGMYQLEESSVAGRILLKCVLRK